MKTQDEWDAMLEGIGEYPPLTGPDATVPQGTATGAQKRPVARFGGWRGVLAVCAVLACLWGAHGLVARSGGEAGAGGEDETGVAAFDRGFNIARTRNPPPVVVYDTKPDPPGMYKDGPPR